MFSLSKSIYRLVRNTIKELGPVLRLNIEDWDAIMMGVPLGFDSGGTTLIQAASHFQLTSRPQEIFRGERFIIGSDIAPSLVVSDLRVGNRSQLINATNVPGMAFANTTIGASLRWETAQPGQDVIWTGLNISGVPIRALACLMGTSLLGPSVQKESDSAGWLSRLTRTGKVGGHY